MIIQAMIDMVARQASRALANMKYLEYEVCSSLVQALEIYRDYMKGERK